MKKAKITSTNKSQFFGLLKRAALPLSQKGQQKLAVPNLPLHWFHTDVGSQANVVPQPLVPDK